MASAGNADIWQSRQDGLSLRCYAKPRASRSGIIGVTPPDAGQAALIVALTAPPVDGAANDEMIRTIARAFGVKRAAISIHSGESGRTKLVHITGEPAALAAKAEEIISAFPDKR